MNVIGSASGVSARQYMATSRVEAKGLDQLVKDPSAALRRLGEQSLTPATTERAQNTPPVPLTSDRSLVATLTRNAIEETRAVSEKPSDDSAAKKELTVDEAAAGEAKKAAPGELSPEEDRAVQQMKARDREVRAHEQAHKNVGGAHAGAISYSYQQGPNGKQYAIGGSVPIDVSPEATPEATIAKMRVVMAAALAPADPSGPDRAIAQAAQAQMTQASADARAAGQAEAEELREASAEKGGDLASLHDNGEGEPNASAVAGMLVSASPDSPYKALDVIDFNSLGKRHVVQAA